MNLKTVTKRNFFTSETFLSSSIDTNRDWCKAAVLRSQYFSRKYWFKIKEYEVHSIAADGRTWVTYVQAKPEIPQNKEGSFLKAKDLYKKYLSMLNHSNMVLIYTKNYPSDRHSPGSFLKIICTKTAKQYMTVNNSSSFPVRITTCLLDYLWFILW
jgi:hypothetical protein